VALSVLEQKSTKTLEYFLSGLRREFPAIIANLASYKIIKIINLLGHINILKREKHDDILKMHFSLKCTQCMKIDG